MTPQPADVAAALTDAVRAMHNLHTYEETLDAVVGTARLAVPGFDHVSISAARRDGAVETVAGTDQLVWQLDEVQYSLGEGPCLESLRSGPVVVVENVDHERRWPRYVPHAVEAGVRSQLGVRLSHETEVLGGLNLYSTEKSSVDERTRRIAELFAAHAVIALVRARNEEQLNQALGSRKIIGQATGIVMERYQISEERAFQFLVRASQTSNLKLRTIAEEIVAGVNVRFGEDEGR